jgi:predicted nucleic acid-binding protein
MYLLDTVILSELRRRQRDPRLVRWVSAQRPSDLYLSVITLGEIECGITQQRSLNPEFADALAQWLDNLLNHYSDRVLPVTTDVARRWGALSARLGRDGADLMIAATALENGLSVVTRNTKHFKPTGVAVKNPFTAG